MRKYPECFPDDFEKDILPREAKEENIKVYRIIKRGTIDRDAFLSTFEEIEKKLSPPRKILDLTDPGTYSTSCNIEYSEAEYFLDIFMRHYPEPKIAKGETEATCGPSQLTSERKIKCANTHVDWWIYEGASPQKYFSEVKIKNE